MDVDATKIRARGPWVLVEIEKPRRVSGGGIYLPEGNKVERTGYSIARVISACAEYRDPFPVGLGWVDRGVLKKKGQRLSKSVVVPMPVKPGDRVLFRGYLFEFNKHEVVYVDDTHAFMLITDLLGVMEEGAELDLCLPHNN